MVGGVASGVAWRHYRAEPAPGAFPPPSWGFLLLCRCQAATISRRWKRWPSRTAPWSRLAGDDGRRPLTSAEARSGPTLAPLS